MKLPSMYTLLVLVGLMFSATLTADNSAPISIEGPVPDPNGQTDTAASGREVADLPADYVLDEFFISGFTDVYTYAPGNVHLGEKILKAEALPYTTRILVKRPANARHFNRTVVIESLNSSAGFDSAPSWTASAEYFARRGIVYIGVSTSANQALPYLVGGCAQFGAPPACGDRYASLQMSDNGQEYELINQLATALKSRNRPLPKKFRSVKRVFLTGQSQQGGSVITHASEFHHRAIDGYFFQGASRARVLSNGAPRLEGDEQRVRTDLPVPVYRGSSETDIGDGSTRQDDTDTSRFASFRLVEVPGSSHNTVHKVEILPGLSLSDLCENQPYSLADGPIFGSHVWNAMWENMRLQVDHGIKPPYAPRVEIVDGVIQRDEFENALGGVRLPEFNLPTASYFSPNNTGKRACEAGESPPVCVPPELAFIAGLACRLNGSQRPFTETELDALYPSHRHYVAGIFEETLRTVRRRFLLIDDAVQHIATAIESDIGR